MLRLFEEKGLAKSTYKRASGKVGPGRTEVCHEPTERARRLVAQLASDCDIGNWEDVKELMFNEVQQGEIWDPELTEEVLARIPPDETDILRYCVEVMTIMALRLRYHTGRQLLVDYLPKLVPSTGDACRSQLGILAGFALGLLADENVDDLHWQTELLEHVKRYQSFVVDMDPATCRRLAEYLMKAFSPLVE